MFCTWVDGKTTEIIKILKLVREFRVKIAKMLKGSVSGQIFQPAENSSGSFLSLSGRSRHSHMRDPGLKKNFFSAPRASVWSKKKEGGGQPTGPSPGSATESHRIHSSEQEKKKHINKRYFWGLQLHWRLPAGKTKGKGCWKENHVYVSFFHISLFISLTFPM